MIICYCCTFLCFIAPNKFALLCYFVSLCLSFPCSFYASQWPFCSFNFIISACPALPPVTAVSPLHFEEFSRELANHPNQQQVSYVLRGIQFGFRLGFHPSHKLKPAKKNKPFAVLHAPVIDDYLANEVMLGRVAGPFPSPPLPNLHVSSFGVIPKKGQPGKWTFRLRRAQALTMA